MCHPCDARVCRGQKKHMNFFNINFLAPTQVDPPPPPQNASVPGKRRQKRTCTNLFRGILGSKRGSQTGRFWSQKVYCFFLALTLSGSNQGFSEGLFRGFRAQGAQKQSSCTAIEDTLITQTPCLAPRTFLEGPFGGFRVQDAQKRSSNRESYEPAD